MHKFIRKFLRRHRARFALVIIGMVVSFGAAAYGLNAIHDASAIKPAAPTVQAGSASHSTSKLLPKPGPVPAAATKPAPTSAPASIPAPKPAADVTKSPAAVASTNTAPGTGVSSLAPTDNSPPPATTDTTSPPDAPAPTCTNTPGSYASSNWAGYFRTGCTFTAVSGAWTVPTATTTSTTDETVDSTWIGIGGVNTQDLIQVGTEETVETDGTINAAVFYELLPDAPHYPVIVTVSPGDHMSASLSETSPNLWIVSITDVTTGRTFTKSIAYTSSHTSAEWIEEDPSFFDGSLVPFDNFGTVTFTDGSSTGNGVTGSLSDASSIVILDQQDRTVAVPTAVSGAGNDTFSVVRRIR